MSRNNFKLLEENEHRHYPGAPPQIKSNIESEMGVLKMIGNIVDMYLPKVLEVFVMMTGGKVDRMTQQYDNNAREWTGTDRRGPSSTILPPDKNVPPPGPGSPEN